MTTKNISLLTLKDTGLEVCLPADPSSVALA